MIRFHFLSAIIWRSSNKVVQINNNILFRFWRFFLTTQKIQQTTTKNIQQKEIFQIWSHWKKRSNLFKMAFIKHSLVAAASIVCLAHAGKNLTFLKIKFFFWPMILTKKIIGQKYFFLKNFPKMYLAFRAYFECLIFAILLKNMFNFPILLTNNFDAVFYRTYPFFTILGIWLFGQ